MEPLPKDMDGRIFFIVPSMPQNTRKSNVPKTVAYSEKDNIMLEHLAERCRQPVNMKNPQTLPHEGQV